MSFTFGNIASQIENVTDNFSQNINSSKPVSDINAVSDEELKRRIVIRVIIVTVILSFVAILIYRKTRS